MNLIKFFFINLVLCSAIFLTATYSDRYISKPYTLIDLVTLIISLVIYYIVFTLFNKVKKAIKHGRYEVLIFILAILTAAIITGAFLGT
ncbi:hypothetical protein CN692_04740 [Bacillus sp. AFS002410]|nr:hypothetical protein CN692_04740 [Bacillus sp. AFS002410]